MEIMKKLSVWKLIVALAIPLVLGGVAGLITTQAIPTWYASLNKPSFNPPNSVFGPVWTVLYILMGISLYLIWQFPSGESRNRAMVLFGIQMALNFAWSFLFFYFHEMGLALLDIIALWIAIVSMMLLFYKVRPVAAYLNIPYLLWVSFATTLNAAYWHLN